MKDYHINIFYSEEDEGYIADIPDLAFCSAFGETPEDALFQAMIAKKAWLEAIGVGHKILDRTHYCRIIYLGSETNEFGGKNTN